MHNVSEWPNLRHLAEPLVQGRADHLHWSLGRSVGGWQSWRLHAPSCLSAFYRSVMRRDHTVRIAPSTLLPPCGTSRLGIWVYSDLCWSVTKCRLSTVTGVECVRPHAARFIPRLHDEARCVIDVCSTSARRASFIVSSCSCIRVSL